MSRMFDPASPALYPLRRQDDRVGLLQLDEDAYRRASFLDERLLEGGVALQWRDWTPFAEANPAGRRTHFIFHIGHVGSTLLSRLLGEHPALFSVREPALLREAAIGALAADQDRLLTLLARVWRPEQTALVKATSFVSEIAPALMARSNGGRALLLSSTPPTYLRAILGGPASRQEAKATAPTRQARLTLRLGRSVDVAGEGEAVAMAWLCEALSLCALVDSEPGRCLWLDFDRVLAEPAAALRLCVTHLGVDPGALDAEALVKGPLMRRYSKGPEHAYDADLRRRVLEQAGRDEALEVRRGMDWLQRMHVAHPAVGPALQRAAMASRASLAAAAAAL